MDPSLRNEKYRERKRERERNRKFRPIIDPIIFPLVYIAVNKCESGHSLCNPPPPFTLPLSLCFFFFLVRVRNRLIKGRNSIINVQFPDPFSLPFFNFRHRLELHVIKYRPFPDNNSIILFILYTDKCPSPSIGYKLFRATNYLIPNGIDNGISCSYNPWLYIGQTWMKDGRYRSRDRIKPISSPSNSCCRSIVHYSQIFLRTRGNTWQQFFPKLFPRNERRCSNIKNSPRLTRDTRYGELAREGGRSNQWRTHEWTVKKKKKKKR